MPMITDDMLFELARRKVQRESTRMIWQQPQTPLAYRERLAVRRLVLAVGSGVTLLGLLLLMGV